MKNVIMFVLFMILSINFCIGQEIDTLYYDKDWKVVKNAYFASYYRIYDVSNGSKVRKPFRDYYITGELQAEGGYISIDAYDDSKSVFDGEMIGYYKNGNIQFKRFEDEGVVEGEVFFYYENGNLKEHAYLKKGKFDGVWTKIDENGNLYQAEYENGNPKYDFYYLCTRNGACGKIRFSDNQLIWESPKMEEQKSTYYNGTNYRYYTKNGVQVIVSAKLVKEYGKKWYQLGIKVTNNSLATIEFGTDNISATVWNPQEDYCRLPVWTAQEFTRRIQRQQNFAAIAVGIAEGLNSAFGNDGMSISHTDSYSQRNGFSSSTTVTYNAYEAQLQRTMRLNQLIDWENAMTQERMARNEGYIKRTTINSGEAISGYVNIERMTIPKQSYVEIDVIINGATYEFDYDLTK